MRPSGDEAEVSSATGGTVVVPALDQSAVLDKKKPAAPMNVKKRRMMICGDCGKRYVAGIFCTCQGVMPGEDLWKPRPKRAAAVAATASLQEDLSGGSRRSNKRLRQQADAEEEEEPAARAKKPKQQRKAAQPQSKSKRDGRQQQQHRKNAAAAADTTSAAAADAVAADADGEPMYYPERIVGMATDANQVKCYRIKWFSYDDISLEPIVRVQADAAFKQVLLLYNAENKSKSGPKTDAGSKKNAATKPVAKPVAKRAKAPAAENAKKKQAAPARSTSRAANPWSAQEDRELKKMIARDGEGTWQKKAEELNAKGAYSSAALHCTALRCRRCTYCTVCVASLPALPAGYGPPRSKSGIQKRWNKVSEAADRATKRVAPTKTRGTGPGPAVRYLPV